MRNAAECSCNTVWETAVVEYSQPVDLLEKVGHILNKQHDRQWGD
jgi:hypothetical protein